jgi:hypothetical protein
MAGINGAGSLIFVPFLVVNANVIRCDRSTIRNCLISPREIFSSLYDICCVLHGLPPRFDARRFCSIR